MAVETKTKDIDGESIEVTQYNGVEGVKIQIKLVKTFAPGIGGALGAVDFSKLDKQNINIEKMTAQILDNLDEEKTFDFLMRILQRTRINDHEITKTFFNEFFPGKYKLLYKVVAFTLDVNYEDLIAGLREEIAGLFTKSAPVTQIKS